MASLQKDPFRPFDQTVHSTVLNADLDIHGVHARSTQANAAAILMLHGFPQDLHICKL